MRPAFFFDANRCTGCQACVLACAIENDLAGALDERPSWRQVLTQNPERRPCVPVVHLSTACYHCADAPCMAACPALAYSRDERGLVQLDGDRCIGCRYCSWACPYDAPVFDETQRVMTKCTFCKHRENGPACVELCPVDALGWNGYEELGGVETTPGLPTLTPGPSARFAPLRTGCADVSPAPVGEADVRLGSPITLKHEWPLLVFSLLVAVLFASTVGSVFGGLTLQGPLFVAGVILAGGVSLLHLGRPERAWRAALNVRRSWLSREIVLFGAFAVLGTLGTVQVSWAGHAAVGAGVLLLFAMDRVYDLVRPLSPRRLGRWLHSADLILTGPLLASFVMGHGSGIVLFASIKLILYVAGADSRSTFWGFRCLFGFALSMYFVRYEEYVNGLGAAMIGEAVDRTQFYLELRRPSSMSKGLRS